MIARFNDKGELVVRSTDPSHMRVDFQEPVCCKCGNPIAWIIDMHSWITMPDTSFGLVHAQCAWTSEAFRRLADNEGDET